MNIRMMTCARCSGIQWQNMVDVRTMSDDGPVLIPGYWDGCEDCGHTGAPMEPDRKVPAMGPVHLHPMPPSPDDLLRAAGLWSGLT
jgi:hypothetical protein